MSSDLKHSNRRKQVLNRLIVITVMVTILIVPGYVGMAAAFGMYYGDAYYNAIFDPSYLITNYKSLFDHWLTYHSQLGQDYLTKVILPPVGGFVGSLEK